jgi:hypothetical protein
MECRLAGETDVLGENLPQRHFCPSQNPTWPEVWTRAAAVGSRRLTAWAMARPWNVLVRSNAGIVVSNPTQGMDVCLRLFCVRIGGGLAVGWSLSKESYRLS